MFVFEAHDLNLGFNGLEILFYVYMFYIIISISDCPESENKNKLLIK